jgi:hypothetical protein
MDVFSTTMVSIRLLNALTHLLQTRALGRYTPGFATALAVPLPYFYVLRR